MIKSEMTLRLPKLTAKQNDIATSPAQRKVICEGRRFGKTTLFATIAVDEFLRGRKVIEAAPVAKQTNAFWRKCKKYLKPAIDLGIVRKNETDRTLEMGTGFIQTQTAFDADTLRGDWAHILLLDEYSYMNPNAWEVVGAPMLLDTGGKAYFAFTPNRRNHAHQLYVKALQDESGQWAAFHGTSFDNPYLNQTALDALIQDMPAEMIKQEIYAEFLEAEGQVFRNLTACMGAPLEPTPEDHKGHHIIAGLDWGKQHDYTATSIGCATCKREIARDRFNKIDYQYQYKRIADLWQALGVVSALVEINSIGQPGFEALERAGLPVVAFETTGSSKPPLIENMGLVFERAEWQFQADPIWQGELEAYERKVNAITGRSSYSAPESLHDDTVMARALMLWLTSGNMWWTT